MLYDVSSQLYHDRVKKEAAWREIGCLNSYVLLCGSVVEHCISCAKGCGFDSQGTHILMKMYNLNAIVSCFG